MKSSLADVLEVALHDLPHALASPAAVTRLRTQANMLAPAACAGLE